MRITRALAAAGFALVALVEQDEKKRAAIARLRSPSCIVVDLRAASSGIARAIVEVARATPELPEVRVAMSARLLAMKVLSMRDARLQDRIDPRGLLATGPKVAPLSSREVASRIRAFRARAEEPVGRLFVGDRIELVPPASAVHVWSPQLTLDLSESDGGTRIRGRFAPHPHVWSLYLAVHAVGAFGTIGAAMVGTSQHLARQSPWALWALPIAPVLAALVWAFAFVGQGLGAEQMYTLRRFVDEALATEQPPRPSSPEDPAEATTDPGASGA